MTTPHGERGQGGGGEGMGKWAGVVLPWYRLWARVGARVCQRQPPASATAAMNHTPAPPPHCCTTLPLLVAACPVGNLSAAPTPRPAAPTHPWLCCCRRFTGVRGDMLSASVRPDATTWRWLVEGQVKCGDASAAMAALRSLRNISGEGGQVLVVGGGVRVEGVGGGGKEAVCG
jgi:hypothetical protein